jgi:cell division transport system permease protein
MRYLFKALMEIRRASRFQPLSIVGTVVTIFLAMLLPGLFWVAANNLSAVEQKLKINMTVDVFLRDDVSHDEIDKMRDEFLAMDYITDVIYFSKQDALYKMRESFGQDIIQDLDRNPLPASFSLVVDELVLEPGAADSLIARIAAMDKVEEVVFARDILDQFSRITNSVKKFGIIIAVLVIFSGIFISANTVRVAITDRKEVVEIMQIVGASRSYILTPFVLLGGSLGLIGTILSAVLLWYITRYISLNLVELKFLIPSELTAFILSGLLLGMLGSVLATKRYLKI